MLVSQTARDPDKLKTPMPFAYCSTLAGVVRRAVTAVGYAVAITITVNTIGDTVVVAIPM